MRGRIGDGAGGNRRLDVTAPPGYGLLLEKVVRVARALHETDSDAGYDAIAEEWAAKLDQADAPATD